MRHFAICWCVLALATAASGAVWTGADGTTVDGDLLSYDAGTVKIRGKGFVPQSLPIEWFQPKDRQAIRQAECKARFRRYAEKKTGLSAATVEGYWKEAQDNAKKVKPDLEEAVKYYTKIARKNRRDEYAKTQKERAEKCLAHCKQVMATPLEKMGNDLLFKTPTAPAGLRGPFLDGRNLRLAWRHVRSLDAYYHSAYGVLRQNVQPGRSAVGQMGLLKGADKCLVVSSLSEMLHCTLNGRRFAVSGVPANQYKEGDTVTLSGAFEVLEPVGGVPMLLPLSENSVKKSAKPAVAPLDVAPADLP
jgi:hypothetical protein